MQRLSNEQLLFIENNWKTTPINALAAEVKVTPLELCKLMRIHGIATDVRDIELIFIRKSVDNGVPLNKIQAEQGFSDTQFSQICSRIGIKQKRTLDDLSEIDIVKSTRWLIEECLKMAISDFLPRKIRQNHFIDNGLYDCIRYAHYHKNKDPYYKHFSAVAYLVCKAYPGTYRPFQFVHAKSNKYFKGNGGKSRYMQALIWVITEKMGIDLDYIDTVKSNNFFLKSKDLSFYGLGYHAFKNVFNSIQEVKKELIKRYSKENNTFEKSTKLKNKLNDHNISLNCFVNGCSFKDPTLIEIHHIIPKEHKDRLDKLNLDIDAFENLIPLCPNHHARAHQLVKWKQFLNQEPSNWRQELEKQLSSL
ncbi:HNH endonuclease signature motif containing protein [Aquibacillus sediminis]|uniref:HNH endonuclease signature motif containing protein n=1 Tax=Aquibacillus sediminis TaxID=2574734 RepID=UPI001109549D|nr:HNH endonuclease signature motif containing protein [Aquibacillus sediminis]